MDARTLPLLLLALALGCTSVEAPAGQCRYDSDCEDGQVCAGTFCRAGCRTDRDCPTGQRCGETDRVGVLTCIPMMINAQCNRASDCPAGLVCLDGACRPQCQQDYDCQVLNPFFSCMAGVCSLRCAGGTADCDGDPRNGCEVDTTSSASHCGTCTTACASAPNADGACAVSTCTTRCRAGFADCDGNAANGCEVTLATDAANCGVCRNVCPGVANADGVCAASACSTRCRAGFADCDGNAANGCEVNLATDAANCGACRTACPGAANADGACAASTCGRQCRAGFADCDGDASNGCEVTLASDAAHCAACGTGCPSAPNADGVCMASMCGRQCRAGFADCDGNAANGCEVTLATDSAHCGTCATACSFPNAAPVCAAGACGLGACGAGFGNCDGSAANGCETPLNTSANCGACGTTCGAGTVCSMGACTSICTGGTTFCSGSCVNTATSTANCGMCGRACTAPANAAATCAASTCDFVCNAGYSRFGQGCIPIAAGRPVSPASLSTLNGNTGVTFEVALAPNTDGATIELCRDRACTMPVERVSGTGNRVTRAGALPAGLYFWRAYGRVGTNTGLVPSTQTWEVVVPARAVTATASWGTVADFNGDGFADLAIGEPGGDRAYIYHGAATGLPATATRTIDDETITGGFGNYVTAGDFNGDGFADLAVASDSSLVYIYTGGPAGLSATPTTRTGSPGYGDVIQAASDLNRDGYADLAVGFSCFSSTCRSGADIYLGSAAGLGTTPTATITGPDRFSSFSQMVEAGRVSDSPYGSLAVLVLGKGTSNLLVFRGTATGINTTPVQDFEPTPGTYFLAGAYDVNGDGFGDIVTGTEIFKGPSSMNLYLGAAAGLPPRASLSFSSSDHLGGPVAGLGDVNGDGFGDVVAGDGYSDVQVYFGGAATALTAGPVTAVPTPPSGVRYPNFGSDYPFFGDFNRDNLNDLIVGARPDFDGDCGHDYFAFPGRTGTSAAFSLSRTLTIENGECFGGVE